MQLVFRTDILCLAVSKFDAAFAWVVLHDLQQHRLLITELLLILLLHIR